MEDELWMTPAAVGLRLNVPRGTLLEWRWDGRGPAFTPDAEAYHVDDVIEWEMSRVAVGA